jgi:hypothetical protein
MEEVKIGGSYRHFKNKKLHKVIALAKHSENLEDFVVYEDLYDNPLSKTWVRPLSMFTEEVEHEGVKVKRFTLEE